MVMRLRSVPLVTAVLVGSAVVVTAQAGDHKVVRHHHRHHQPVDINMIAGTGTYSGSITVYHADGIGTSTWARGTGMPAPVEREIVMKIIEVNADETAVSDACSMEEGVCVIRP